MGESSIDMKLCTTEWRLSGAISIFYIISLVKSLYCSCVIFNNLPIVLFGRRL